MKQFNYMNHLITLKPVDNRCYVYINGVFVDTVSKADQAKRLAITFVDLLLLKNEKVSLQ